MERRYRLVHSSRFRQVYRDGRSLVHPLLVLRTLDNGLPYSRFGFVVSKRIGKAVERNRVKRLMREAMRANRADVPCGLDVVLIARTPIVYAAFHEITEALERLVPLLCGADSRSLRVALDPAGSHG